MASKTAGADIKVVISVLCKQLKLIFGYTIKPEHFRLAKFNESKENTVKHFWTLLYKICKEEVYPQIPDDGSLVHFVKLSFLLLKYESIAFYILPCDMSQGSRELLLAFSWLIASTHLLEKVTRNRVTNSSINKEYYLGNLDKGDSKEIAENCDSKETTENCHSKETTENCHSKRIPRIHESKKIRNKDVKMQNIPDYVLWLSGKIRHNIKSIEELDVERMKILHKVHKATVNVCGLTHLSVADTRLIHDPKAKASTIAKLNDDIVLIETHAHWTKKHSVYWEWMESVVELKESSSKPAITVEEKTNLMSFLVFMRKCIKVFMNNTDSMEFGPSDQPFSGVPRYSFQNKECCEVEKWLQDSELQVKELEGQHELLLRDVEVSLEMLTKNLKHICILNN